MSTESQSVTAAPTKVLRALRVPHGAGECRALRRARRLRHEAPVAQARCRGKCGTRMSLDGTVLGKRETPAMWSIRTRSSTPSARRSVSTCRWNCHFWVKATVSLPVFEGRTTACLSCTQRRGPKGTSSNRRLGQPAPPDDWQPPKSCTVDSQWLRLRRGSSCSPCVRAAGDVEGSERLSTMRS